MKLKQFQLVASVTQVADSHPTDSTLSHMSARQSRYSILCSKGPQSYTIVLDNRPFIRYMSVGQLQASKNVHVSDSTWRHQQSRVVCFRANMADDGESLESWLSKYTAKLPFHITNSDELCVYLCYRTTGVLHVSWARMTLLYPKSIRANTCVLSETC